MSIGEELASLYGEGLGEEDELVEEHGLKGGGFLPYCMCLELASCDSKSLNIWGLPHSPPSSKITSLDITIFQVLGL